jgi:hypothetical protein
MNRPPLTSWEGAGGTGRHRQVAGQGVGDAGGEVYPLRLRREKGKDDVDVFHDELGIDEPQTIDPAAVRFLDDLDGPADGLPVAHPHGKAESRHRFTRVIQGVREGPPPDPFSWKRSGERPL